MRSGIFLLALLATLSRPAGALTLTFDDLAAGGFVYYGQYNVHPGGSFRVADHSQSSWGPPRSGDNVLVNYSTTPLNVALIKFGYQEEGGQFVREYIWLFGAYFSTQPGVVIRIEATHPYIGEVASATIGDPEGAWENVYVELTMITPASAVWFYPVSSSDALFGYCADDMTIEFVPEPSSLAALLSGLAAAGAVGVGRRR